MKWFGNRTFRKVIAQTNIFDVAIGFAVAVAFVNLVTTFVKNILTPPIGALVKGKSLANFELHLTFLPGDDPVLFRYGLFLDACIEFILVAFVVYWVARLVLRIKKSGLREIENQRDKACQTCFMLIPRKAKKCPFCQTSTATPIEN